jgi:hypothetical protein
MMPILRAPHLRRALRRALAFLLFAATPAAAQEDSVFLSLPVGATVRALDFTVGRSVYGTVESRSVTALVLRQADGQPHPVSADNLRGLWIRGPRSRPYGARTGSAWGAVLGITLGVGIHFAGEWFSDASFADAGPQNIIAATGLGGAAIGTVVGFVVGRHRWTELR